MMKHKTAALAVLTSLAAGAFLATWFAADRAPSSEAAEAAIRQSLTAKLTSLPPIDEVAATPVPGLYEVRVGEEVFYSDAHGAYLIRGELLDLVGKRNLTEERIAKLSAIDFASLPLEDAIVWKTGSGARKIAVFSDPNCGYCKRFERELSGAQDLTVYTFLYPILGGDSPEKSEAIWCAADATATYRGWMVDGKAPPELAGECTSPIERNVELGRKLRVHGTPAIFFEDGSRVPGMLTGEQLERQLASVTRR